MCACVCVCRPHHDAERFEDVEFTHGTGAVFVQPGVHTHLMEDMSAGRHTHRQTGDDASLHQRVSYWSNWCDVPSAWDGQESSLTCRAGCEPRRSAGMPRYRQRSG